jgi:hypothetical protein
MAVIGAVGSFLGGREQKKGAEAAADAQVKAQKIATDEAKRQFDAMMERTEPQYDAGMNALAKQMFYAGVPVPTGMANQVSEAGGNVYPQMDPFTGAISYPGDALGGGQGQVAPPPGTGGVNDWLSQTWRPEGQLFGNPYEEVTNQQWLEDFMRQQEADSNAATKEWLYGSG